MQEARLINCEQVCQIWDVCYIRNSVQMVLFRFRSNFSSQHIPQQIQHKHMFLHISQYQFIRKQCVCAAGIQCNNALGVCNLLTIEMHQSAVWQL